MRMSGAGRIQKPLQLRRFHCLAAGLWCVCSAVAAASMCGCAGDSASSATRGIERAEAYVGGQSVRGGGSASGREQSRLAMIDGSPVTLDRLAPALLEAAGGAALEELVIDMMLAREAERLGVRIDASDVDRERERLVASLARTGDGDEGERLLREMRRARGLGAERFRALLERTALMRAIVADDVSVNEAAIRQAYELRHGVRYRARLITVPTAAEAAEARRRLSAGESFGEVAARMSTDVSAERGGLIEEISPADPSYPAAVRSALQRLTEGQVSPPVAIGDGFAILLLDGVTPPDDADFESVRPELEEQVRRRQERLLMDRLAERLLEGARVTIFDAGLRRSWEVRRRPETR